MRIVGLDLSTKRVGFAAADGELFSISAHAGAEDPYRRLHEPVQTERDRIRARLLAEMEAEHESLSARPDRVAAAEALIDRIIPDPANPKGER